MADGTKIEWSEATWNVITGCSVKSPGCTNCYAMGLAGTRLKHHESRMGLTKEVNGNHVWNGQVRFNSQWLDQPIRWTKPRMIFVCAHGDLFHENVPDIWIDRVFAVMALCPQHTFQVLTKRSDRMREYLTNDLAVRVQNAVDNLEPDGFWKFPDHEPWVISYIQDSDRGDHLPNVWLGVSVEDQQRADERIPDLLQTPAAVRWLSCEPLLGPVDLRILHYDGMTNINALTGDHGVVMPVRGRGRSIDWVVAGGESGKGARPMHPDWARGLRDQCAAAGVPFFFKQWGAWVPDFEHCPDRPDDDAEQSRFATCVWDSEAGRFDETNGSWMDSDQWYFAPNYSEPEQPMTRIGKKRAGRLLDGVEHNGMPEVAHG